MGIASSIVGAVHSVPVVENIELVNLTGHTLVFCRHNDDTRCFEQFHAIDSAGPAPTLVSDDIALRDIVVEHKTSNGIVPYTGVNAERHRITTRQSVPRSIHGLPDCETGRVYIVSERLFYAARCIGRRDVATPAGPVPLADAVTGWLGLLEPPPTEVA